MLELVIFDMDGLMFATEQVNCRAFMEVVKEEGYHPTFEQFTSFLGMNARDIQKKYYDYYGEDTDAEGIYKKVGSRAKQIIKEEGVPEKNGLRELLNAVKEKKLHTAVASGSDTSVIKEYLENGNIINSVNFPGVNQARVSKVRLCIINKNVPNILASISKLFADYNLNIENMVNRSRGEYAYTLIDTNDDVCEDIVEKIESSKGIISVRSIIEK